MSNGNIPVFNSEDEEIKYWKELANQYVEELVSKNHSKLTISITNVQFVGVIERKKNPMNIYWNRNN